MKVILATNNIDKVKEIEEILDVNKWEYFTLKELNIDSDPVEDGTSFLENAKIKAYSAKKEGSKDGYIDYAYLADDSGLCVDALDGAPGLYSARFSEIDGNISNYKNNNDKLIDLLQKVPDEKRGAYFQTDIVLLLPDGTEINSSGRCYGRIAHNYKGEGGFGYDPLFCPKVFNYEISMAQLPPGGKSQISHRGKALRDLKAKISEIIF